MKLRLHPTSLTTLRLSAVLALLSLASVQPLAAVAQQARQAPAPAAPAAAHTPAAAEEEEPAATPNKPGHEGIRVHGDWVIDVHNADGSLAEHRAFHNSLAEDQGENVLFYLLSGQMTSSSLAIGVFDQFSAAGFSTTLAAYYLTQTNANVAGLCNHTYVCVPGETVTVTPGTRSAPGGTFGGTSLIPGKIVLQGQVAPGNAFTINNVQTIFIGCHQPSYAGAATLSPAACTAATPSTLAGAQTDLLTFTQTGIPDVVVAAGQYVVVAVTISFS